MSSGLNTQKRGSGAPGRLELVKYHRLDLEFATLPSARISSRLVAGSIDLIFFTAILELLSFCFEHILSREQLSSFSFLLNLLTWTGYFVVPLYFRGYTLGKKALGLRLVRQSAGSPIKIGNLVLRCYLGMQLSIMTFFLGYLLGAVSKRKLTFHDRLSGTKVVQEEFI